MLRVGQIDYINVLPLFLGLTSGEIDHDAELVPAVPSELNRQLREGKLDLSFVSSREYLCHREAYDLVLPYGIAAKRELGSVTLYVRGELGDEPIGLTPQSASSAPRFETLRHGIDYGAFLLIGDEALRHPNFPGYRSIDLTKEWFDLTGLPMVFGLLAARKGTTVSPFVEQLGRSLEWAKAHHDQLIAAAMQRVDLSPNELASYYDQLWYELGEEELAGLARYDELSAAV
jgi:chorismate dehydratase